MFLGGPCVFDVRQTASVYPSVFLPFVFRGPAFLNMCPNSILSGDTLITGHLYKILSRGFSSEVIYIYIYIYMAPHSYQHRLGAIYVFLTKKTLRHPGHAALSCFL